MEVLSSLFTILIIVSLGVLSRKFEVFKTEHGKTLSSFVYYFGLPALFFVKIAELDLLNLDPRLVSGSVLPTAVLLSLLLVLRWAGVLRKDTFVLLGLSISFGSYAFFGIAFFETFQEGRWLEQSIIAASILGIFGIISTLTLLEYARQQKKSGGFLKKIFTNPLILFILLGIIFSLTGIRLNFLNHALSLVGQTASGLAIFVLGIFIHDRFSWKTLVNALPYSLFRMITLPLISWITIWLFMPSIGDVIQFLLLENSMPAAIGLVVFAERYDYKVTETAGIVSLTSMLSFIGLTVIYYLSLMIL